MNFVSFKNGDTFPNLIRGVWQLSQGHQDLNEPGALSLAIEDAIECGFTTFDCADIYLGTEELLGRVGAASSKGKLRFHTKYVPDLDQLSNLTPAYTESIIDRSLKRLRVDSLDLVQFHWWDYRIPKYLDALEHLSRLQERGKIRTVGVTNFNTDTLRTIEEAGFEIGSIQLQASLIDRRAQGRMKQYCEAKKIRRLGYGSLLGGFISARWIGVSEPSEKVLKNRSLNKYKRVIEAWGGWERFQSFLSFLSDLAEKYGVTVGQLAIQSMLQSGQVDAVICGLSPVNYREQNRELNQPILISAEDILSLNQWNSPLVGDVYELERDPRHAYLMRTHLNRER